MEMTVDVTETVTHFVWVDWAMRYPSRFVREEWKFDVDIRSDGLCVQKFAVMISRNYSDRTRHS